MRTWAFDLLGGPHDGAAGLGYADVHQAEPPERMLVGTCLGELCWRDHAHDPHAWWWLECEADFAPADAAGYVLVARQEVDVGDGDGSCIYVSDDMNVPPCR